MGKKAYKAGLVSSILTETAENPPALDPKLCAIFGSSQYAVKPGSVQAESNNSQVKKPKKKKAKVADNGVSQDTVTKAEPVLEAKKKKKQKQKLAESVETAVSDTPKPKKSKKLKAVQESSEEVKPKRKKMKKLINSEYDVVSRKKAKKLQGGLKRKAVDDEEVGGKVKKLKKGTKVEKDNDTIIEEFEREQQGSSSDSENDDDEKDEKKASPGSALKNFELNAPKEKDPEKESRTVFVGNLPTDVKEKAVLKLFKEFGKIETIRFRGAIPLKPYLLKKAALNTKKLNPDQYNLTAYIRFATREEAEIAAKKMNGFLFNKHHLVTDLADNKKHDNKRAVFVGNLPLKTHEDELRSFFSECGPISSVRVIRNAVTGVGKGFGYVNFETPECVELALKKGGEELGGRQIRVSRAVKKEKKTKEQILKKKADDLALRQSMNKKNAEKRLARKNPEGISFTGDKLAEKGSSKKKSKKPNRGELRKARLAAKLTGVPTTQVKKKIIKKKERKN